MWECEIWGNFLKIWYLINNSLMNVKNLLYMGDTSIMIFCGTSHSVSTERDCQRWEKSLNNFRNEEKYLLSTACIIFFSKSLILLTEKRLFIGFHSVGTGHWTLETVFSVRKGFNIFFMFCSKKVTVKWERRGNQQTF